MMSRNPQEAELSPDGKSLTIRLPLTLRRRGGRKVVISPAGEQLVPQPWAKPRSGIDESLVKTLAQAFQWQQLLDDGQFGTVGDLALAKRLDQSFVSRILRLTLLAPDIVEAILDGTQAPAMQRQNLLHGFPLEWDKQQEMTEA
jgi:virulence-associated protein VagC